MAAEATPKGVLNRAKLEKIKAKAEKKGVVYLSRVPPFMKPEKVKHLLGKYGEIGRIYLVPEDKTNRKKRVSSGGNRKQCYTEGWIEFMDKSVAKTVAKALNTQPIGGKKRDFYHDDIWNLKYLKGFKWDHLTEKIAFENRIRDQKLRMEIAQAKKENDAYLERVEQSKQFEKMEERKHSNKRKLNKDSHDHDRSTSPPERPQANDSARNNDSLQQIRRSFHQKMPMERKQHKREVPEDTYAVLGKVFASNKRQKQQ